MKDWEVEGRINVGDLVRNLNSESGLTGIVLEFTVQKAGPPGKKTWKRGPIVLWADGRRNWIVPSRVKAIR